MTDNPPVSEAESSLSALVAWAEFAPEIPTIIGAREGGWPYFEAGFKSALSSNPSAPPEKLPQSDNNPQAEAALIQYNRVKNTGLGTSHTEDMLFEALTSLIQNPSLPPTVQALAEKECETYTGPATCFDDADRKPNAQYGAEQYCAPCELRNAAGYTTGVPRTKN